MARTTRLLAACGALLGASVLTACDPPPTPWSSQLASVNAAGTDSGDRSTSEAVVSPEGTRVAFVTGSSDLGPTDTNGWPDIYLRDLTTGTVSLVTTNEAGTDSGNHQSLFPAFSPDGTELVFTSRASDLTAGPVRGLSNVYVRDLTAGTTSLVSQLVDGSNPGAFSGLLPSVFSPDGTKVAFSSDAGNLGATDTNGVPDIYVRDLTTGTITLASVNAAGTDSGNWLVDSIGGFSADGTKLVFASDATDVTTVPDANIATDVFVRDLVAGTTTLVSANAAGTATGAARSRLPVITPDGREVAFLSNASDLGPVAPGLATNLYVRDLATGTTRLVTADRNGSGIGVEGFVLPVLSPDGHQLAFVSDGDDFGPTDTNGATDVYLHDLATGTNTLVSVDAAGTDTGDRGSTDPVFSGDGTKVAFVSLASDLGSRDVNDLPDVYLRDLSSATTRLVSANAAGTNGGNGQSIDPSPGPDGTRIAFRSEASDLGHDDSTRPLGYESDMDLYVATPHGADLRVELEAAPEPVTSGGPLTYTAELANHGPDAADEAQAVVVLPEGTTFVGASATASSGTCTPPDPAEPRVVRCALGDVAAGEGATVTVEATVSTSVTVGATLTGLAAVSSSTRDPVPTGNVASADSTATDSTATGG